MNVSFKIYCSLLFLIIIISACQQSNEVTRTNDVDQLVIGLSVEPNTLSPILASTSSSREVYQYIFSRLADFDYETLELKPVLIKEIPEGNEINDGPHKGTVAFDIEIREDAVWDNGSDVSAKDVLFTYKIASHPGVPSPSWKEYLKDIEDVIIDDLNPKKFTIYVSNINFQSKEAILSTEIYPNYIYDPKDILSSVSFRDINNKDRSEYLMKDSVFSNLGKTFSGYTFSKEIAKGAGPYDLDTWKTGQYAVLKKKANYWGRKYADIDQLESYPERIVFRFISDQNTTVTLLKNNEIDLIDLSKMPYTQFDDLKVDSSFASRYNFYTPQIPRYLILLLNNEDIRLSDKRVRRALGHLTDVDRIIRQIEGGYARRVNSPIHFSKQEYNKELDFLKFDIQEANRILDEAGWKDTDEDGVRDKMINGRKEDLRLRFHITGSNISTSLYSIVKEACSQAGVQIESVIKPYGATRLENLNTGDYEITIMVKTISPVKRDLYYSYHSSSVGSGGQNYQRYSNVEADRLMELIRSTQDEQERTSAYLKLQKIIADDVPVIYLYSQQLRIVGNKNMRISISDKRPGYFANAIEE